VNQSAAECCGEVVREEGLKKLTPSFTWLHKYRHRAMTQTAYTVAYKETLAFLCFVSLIF